MSDAHALPAREDQTFRVFEGEPHYIDGYVPSSLDSQHSSLLRSSTWIGMGIVLAAVAGIGTLIFGLATQSVGTQENASFFTILGTVMTIAFLVIGFGLIHYGRRHYRAYVAATGRKH